MLERKNQQNNYQVVNSTTSEWFEFFGVSYDVGLAKRLIESNKIKCAVVQLPVDDYVNALSIPIAKDKPLSKATQQLPMFIGIDWDHAAKLQKPDLEKPGIVVETKAGNILIDGNHRLVKAAYDGVKTIPVYHITRVMSKKIIKHTKEYFQALKSVAAFIEPKHVVEAQGNVNDEFYLGDLHFNQRTGLGQVPDNMEVLYKGFAVIMLPEQFHRLTPARTYNEDSLEIITDAIKSGKPIGSPFLSIMKTKKGAYYVSGHEGRTRMKAIDNLYGQVPVLVHVFVDWTRARSIDTTMINNMRLNLIPEKQKTALRGPHFGPKVYFKDQWVTVRANTDMDAVLSRLLAVASTEWINDKYKRDLLARLREAVSDLDFFNTDLECINKFETLLKDLNKRNKLEPLEGTTS